MAQDRSSISSRVYVIYVSVVAAIGGLLFGFDTAIVAGATRYMKEQFSLNSLQEGWAVSIVLIGCALPKTMAEFMIFRFVGGLGIGSASILAPLYIAEISPARIRGALVSVNQLAIVTGILLAFRFRRNPHLSGHFGQAQRIGRLLALCPDVLYRFFLHLGSSA